ncbi:MAG: hypothetical protein J6Z06_03685 [Lachnospiraceae bacterium]|nr:hypothetical protein [Lachnospiraceae bacterium]
MSCVIVAGGSVEDALVEQFARAADCIIAADRGLEALERVGIRPHIIVGDFDSASAACVSHVAD